jgi:hypothetical protein
VSALLFGPRTHAQALPRVPLHVCVLSAHKDYCSLLVEAFPLHVVYGFPYVRDTNFKER